MKKLRYNTRKCSNYPQEDKQRERVENQMKQIENK